MPTRVRKLTPKAAAAAAAKSAKPAGGPPPRDSPEPLAAASFFANDEDVASLLSNLRSGSVEAPAAPPLNPEEANRDTNAVAAEKTGKKPGRKKKHPNAPKGPRSSFKFYQMKTRPNFDASHPGKKFIELSIMGESWKKLSDEEKQPYIDLAVEDIERHMREVVAYEASKPSTDDAGEQEGKKRGRGRPRGPNYKPRSTSAGNKRAKKEMTKKREGRAKPSTASKKGMQISAEDEARVDTAIATVQSRYNGAEGNQKLAKLTLRGVTVRPSGKWQAQLYYAGKSRYLGVFESKMAASLGYEVARELLEDEAEEKTGKRRPGREKKDPNAPKGPRPSFSFYQWKMRPTFEASHSGTTFTELSTLMGESWKKLSDEEKQPYIDLAVKDIERHQREVAAYEASKPSTGDAGEQEGKKRPIEEANKSMVVARRAARKAAELVEGSSYKSSYGPTPRPQPSRARIQH